MKDSIDFLVIGAQKSGTTSLFKYLRRHPSLYLPPQKEVEFFINKNNFSKGLTWYIETYFSGADENKLWGEVCPAYMGFVAAPANIHAYCPNIKLVAILRNPIDRTYSHYRMAVRRGAESQPFRRAVEERRKHWVEAPEIKLTKSVDNAPFLIEFSCYGKTLERYLRYFEREQLLILFQEDLLSAPEKLLAELFSFLEVDGSYVPPNLNRRYHVGGERRWPWFEDWIRRRRLLKNLVKRALISKRNVAAIKLWFRMLNVRPVEDSGPSPEERRYLKEVLEADVALLKSLFSVEPPWPDFEETEKREAAVSREP